MECPRMAEQQDWIVLYVVCYGNGSVLTSVHHGHRIALLQAFAETKETLTEYSKLSHYRHMFDADSLFILVDKQTHTYLAQAMFIHHRLTMQSARGQCKSLLVVRSQKGMMNSRGQCLVKRWSPSPQSVEHDLVFVISNAIPHWGHRGATQVPTTPLSRQPSPLVRKQPSHAVMKSAANRCSWACPALVHPSTLPKAVNPSEKTLKG